MRFLSLIRINENTDQVPSERLMTEMGQLVNEWARAGILLDTAGLAPTAKSKRARLSRGHVSVSDGPFAEAKEVIGGYLMLQASSLEEAVALSSRFLDLHGDEWEIECEVRPLQEADFGAGDTAKG